MSKIADEIRAYVNDFDVADHFGAWGILRRDQRRKIRELCDTCDMFERTSDELVRKQSEGEWETIPDYQPNKLIAYRHICSVCKTFYKDIRPHGHKYCHECGAKMKGGAE